MGRKNKRELPLFTKVEIIDAGAEGQAIARVDDLVVMVPFVVPGDVVDIQTYAWRKRFYEGKAVFWHTYSPDRVEAFCPHFGTCGGCRWQNMAYNKQLFYKQKQVVDHFSRIGKFDFPEVQAILPSPKTREYRNKLEFTFSQKPWLEKEQMSLPDHQRPGKALGFHIPALFDRVLDIGHCYLQAGPSNAIRLAVKGFCIEQGFTFYDPRAHVGLMRNLFIRDTLGGGCMTLVVFGEDDTKSISLLLDFLKSRFPEITSLMYVVNEKHNDTITDLEVKCWSGSGYLTETMPSPVSGFPDLQFRIAPVSFFQTNPLQARQLYQTAFDFATLSGNETVYDLYCGTGTISNFVARKAAQVIGIEYVEQAIADATINSGLNGIANTQFFAGDMAKVLTSEFIAQHGKPDVVITDPPRAGMHEKVISQLLAAQPARIVYVSCNPATQARDIAQMAHQYAVTRVQPVDMFPHTHHVENVALLELK